MYGSTLRRVQAVASAIDREHRFVKQVVGEDAAVVNLIVGEHHDEAVERQEAGERRGLPHGDEIRTSRAIRDSRNHHPVFIDVVFALEGVDDRFQIEDLVVAPPGRLFPGVWEHVNLLCACQRSDFAGASRLIVGPPENSSMKLKANLITPQRVVGGRNVDRVEVLDAILGAVLQLDDAGFLRCIGSAKLQSP